MPGRRCTTAVTRRTFVAVGSVALTSRALPVNAADPNDYKAAYAAATKGVVPKPGRVKLTMPELAENGNAVSMLVDVQSPMTAADHVKTISVLSERNPQALLFRAHFGPRSGRARIATNVRLADTQRVLAIAEMNDGSVWTAEANIVVTLAACVDAG